ncbi:OmpA family protein [Actinokineospora globicatena]|uniref:OmpA-like domain-containing protein n=1 Tax=Actinokineospora globicatena TaxID=103729 RepID=A0A9W6QMR3_9PSEU|nr:OmpA family protein [Actinokineospora globicatena]GLW91198.1 hypothetical protein Aglo03_20140 [Actinokineospora globicatena]
MTSLRTRGDGGRLLHIVVAATAATLLTACGSGDTPTPGGGTPDGSCTGAADKPVSLVVGARMGSKQPTIPGEVKTLLDGAAENQQGLQVFRVDGEPSRAIKVSPVINGKNPSQRRQQVASAVKQVTSVVTDLGPKKPEADVLSALSQAGRLTDDGGTVVVMDSGLATAGAVSFLTTGMFDADPGEVAEFLASKQLLPALRGKTVLLVGLGETAEPQPALDGNLKLRVTALWEAIVAKAGATCSRVVEVAPGRDAAKADQPVSAVALPKPVVFEPCGTTVLADSGAVGFRPNTAQLRDEAAARTTLTELSTLLTGGSQRVTLVGNTATHGTPEASVTLSRQRAEAVKALLVQAGVAADRISTVGDGQTGKYHKPDLGPNGALDPVAAAQNRSVVVELSCAR